MKSYKVYFPVGKFCYNFPQILLDVKMNPMGIFQFFSASVSAPGRF